MGMNLSFATAPRTLCCGRTKTTGEEGGRKCASRADSLALQICANLHGRPLHLWRQRHCPGTNVGGGVCGGLRISCPFSPSSLP